MAQMQWKLASNTGQVYDVGIYHGDRSGHVLIYVDKNIVKIDFLVKTSKQYTFFLDEDLCILDIHKQMDGYTYALTIDKETATPLNKKRKNREIRYLFYTLGLLITFALLIFSIVQYFT